MTTLFNWNARDGKPRRCDARCHNAKNPNCTCICTGTYHGCANKPGGFQIALDHFRDTIAYWKDQEAKAKDEQPEQTLQLQVLQLTLFEET